jgi:hypothetical protein
MVRLPLDLAEIILSSTLIIFDFLVLSSYNDVTKDFTSHIQKVSTTQRHSISIL